MVSLLQAVRCLLWLLVSPTSSLGSNTNTSLLPKLGETASVHVVNVSRDLVAQSWQAKEALLATVVLQGLINRGSSKKVYLVHTPQEHDWTPWPSDAQHLADGMVPAPHNVVQLNGSKLYPALSWMLQQAAPILNGAVLIPPFNNGTEESAQKSTTPNSMTSADGAYTAAAMACAHENAIPLSPAVEAFAKAEGFSFATITSTRMLTTNVAAFHWGFARYLRADTERRFIGQHSFRAFGGRASDQIPVFYDYLVSTKAFIFSLNSSVPEEAALLPLLLNASLFAPGSPVLGLPVDEGKGLTAIQVRRVRVNSIYVQARLASVDCHIQTFSLSSRTATDWWAGVWPLRLNCPGSKPLGSK